MLSSCSAHLYNTSNYNVSETQVVLDKSNFVVIGKAEGRAKMTQILGIGGLSQKSLKGNAIADMYENANLQGSQTIINVNLKQRVSGFIPIILNTEYTATGTIIQFVPTLNHTTSHNYNNSDENAVEKIDKGKLDENHRQTDHLLEVGDVIEFEGVSSTIIGINGSEIILAKQSENSGTWYDAKQYCDNLGEGWTLPNKEQIDYIIHNLDIKFNTCWTNEKVSDKKAKAYYRGYTLPYMSTYKSTNNIGIIAVKAANDEAIE